MQAKQKTVTGDLGLRSRGPVSLKLRDFVRELAHG